MIAFLASYLLSGQKVKTNAFSFLLFFYGIWNRVVLGLFSA